MIVNRLPLSFALALPFLYAACGGEGLTLPPEGEAAHIEVVAGNRQSGRVGSTLGEPLLVQVTDTRNRPVSGATVLFSFATADQGQATPASTTTDSEGRATSTLRLGSTPGALTGKVEVPVDEGITPVEAGFTATALSETADGIAALSGDGQSAPVNSALPAPLVVQVTDRFGNPIPGVTIGWSVTGGGSVSETSTVTDASGQSSVTRTLGGTAGEQTTVATADGLVGSPVTFIHTATAGSATGIVKVSGDGQSALVGTELADPLVVQVLDASGNPIPNRAVTWVTGDGSVDPQNTTTDAQGHASTRWTLGLTPGANKTANAVVSGLETATFTATATAGLPSASNSSVSASPTTITAGSGSSTITVTVRDDANNPVGGVSVSVASSGSENTITPATASTGGNGVATFTFSSTFGETKAITATAGGVPITDGATITVQKVFTETEIESDNPDPSNVGEAVRVVFTVTGTGGSPTGLVTVTADGGDETCSAAVADGFCDITLMSAGSNRRLTAFYEGDSRFASSSERESHQVIAAPPAGTTTNITSDDPDPSAPNEEITVTFTVTSTAGTPAGSVTVTDEFGGSCAADITVGSCAYTPVGAGERTITATYAGNSAFAASSDTEQHTVTEPAPVPSSTTTTITSDTPDTSAPGEQVTVTFTVTSTAGTPAGSVTVTDEFGGSCAADITVGSCAYTPVGVGERTITATYAGDSAFAPSFDTEQHTVVEVTTG